MGVTAILFAYCEYYFYGNKIKLISQIILSIIIMVGSVTNASYLAVILLVIFFVFNKLKMRNIMKYRIKNLEGIIVWHVYSLG